MSTESKPVTILLSQKRAIKEGVNGGAAKNWGTRLHQSFKKSKVTGTSVQRALMGYFTV
jgi:hypothetical protein